MSTICICDTSIISTRNGNTFYHSLNRLRFTGFKKYLASAHACSMFGHGYFSSRVILFSARASKISIRVIILVMLAGRSFVSASFSYITVPVEASIRIADGALTAGVSQCAGMVILHAMTVNSIRKQVNFEIILGNI